MFTHPQFESFRPAKAYNGKFATMNGNQALLSLIATDLIRFGIKAPLAGTIATRVAESLLFNTDASAVHIEFRANGASFAFTTDDAPDAATAAGSRRFRLTFDLGAYRGGGERGDGRGRRAGGVIVALLIMIACDLALTRAVRRPATGGQSDS